MSDVLTRGNSLFYQGLSKDNGSVLLNKREIVSAKQRAGLNVDVTMTSGEVFELLMNPQQFGELTFFLLQVQHSNKE